MKFVFVFAAVFGLAYCDTTCKAPSPNLLDEFKKFAELLPIDKLKTIVLNYVANDEEVQKVLSYLQGDQFAKVVQTVNSQKEVIELYKFLCSKGVPIYTYINTINDLLGLPHVTPAPSRNVQPSARTFRAFLNAIEAVLPLDKLKALFEQEKKTNAVFKEFVDYISSKEFKAMVDKILALPEVKKFREDLEKLGANIEKLGKIIADLLGWPNI